MLPPHLLLFQFDIAALGKDAFGFMLNANDPATTLLHIAARSEIHTMRAAPDALSDHSSCCCLARSALRSTRC